MIVDLVALRARDMCRCVADQDRDQIDADVW